MDMESPLQPTIDTKRALSLLLKFYLQSFAKNMSNSLVVFSFVLSHNDTRPTRNIHFVEAKTLGSRLSELKTLQS